MSGQDIKVINYGKCNSDIEQEILGIFQDTQEDQNSKKSFHDIMNNLKEQKNILIESIFSHNFDKKNITLQKAKTEVSGFLNTTLLSHLTQSLDSNLVEEVLDHILFTHDSQQNHLQIINQSDNFIEYGCNLAFIDSDSGFLTKIIIVSFHVLITMRKNKKMILKKSHDYVDFNISYDAVRAIHFIG
ncbi:hypothetical protein SAMN04487866_10574 [Thermoactinomyces sp. DSM 45891]|uniref:hypothetical protein n=1 Tax=Thermoactinomyces sp. DSM 45891 TaxID=1761907 RepID=UPI00091A2C1E|nr:hypothetical protein [Thermoactinomyces sp. DSM 45891]SFX34705.1 hypothetical protein SAMN04487866_10574 [Thermoactinomyces sp. DSM 45891]